MRNADKIALMEVAKTSNLKDFNGKYRWSIYDIDINKVKSNLYS